MSDPAPPQEVRAAGAVPWRVTADGSVELALVHRPRYDDWSFPKGKLEPGESFADGARREVAEETGLVGELGDPLPDSRYTDHRGRPKVVRWWLLEVAGSAEGSGVGDAGGDRLHAAPHVPNDEVDELRWLAPEAAASLATHAADAELARLAGRRLGAR